VYQNTNASLQFLTATDTNRKKFLIDLLKLDNYVLFFETFKEAVRVTSQEVTSVNAKIDTINKWLVDNKLESIELLPKMNLPKISESDEKTLRQLQLQIENISEKNKKINFNNQLKESLKNFDITQLQKDLQLYPGLKLTNELVGDIGGKKAELTQAKKMVAKYETLKESPGDAVCPACEQEIDLELAVLGYHAHKNEADMLEKDIQIMSDALAEIEKANEIHRKAAQGIKDWEDIFRSIDNELPTHIFDRQDMEEQVTELQTKIQEARSQLEEVIAENERRERHNTRIDIIQEQTTEFETQLSDLVDKLSTLEDEVSILDVLKKAFSTNGLLAYKIESLVKELELLTNEYLAEFSDGRFSINFVVENDKLNVEVSDNGNIIDILALSSGELARVNIATLVAIRKLMTSISRSQINVLFLDEVNQALDEQGKEKIVEILLKEENLNTFLVSHGWTHPLLEKIEIVKTENISNLVG
jgi:DNA repair exonuclease SbcCD ATPase subunit